MRCYRHILEVNWQNHISNNEVRRQVQREWTVIDTMRQRKLQLFGHICRIRASDSCLIAWLCAHYKFLFLLLFNARRPTAKPLVLGMVEGERRPGRPVRRWIDDILMWCGQNVQKTMMMTVDRDIWRRFVAGPYGPCWPREWRRRRREVSLCTLRRYNMVC